MGPLHVVLFGGGRCAVVEKRLLKGYLTLAQPSAQQLVPFWAFTVELSWLVDALMLAVVNGIAALV